MYPEITAVQVPSHYLIHLTFSDGSQGTVDLRGWIGGRGGLFSALEDPGFFSQVTVDREAGTIVWPNGLDLDPEMLFRAAHGMRALA